MNRKHLIPVMFVIWSSAALAQASLSDIESEFDEVDINKDGLLSQVEVNIDGRIFPFSEADVDKDGKLTEDEYDKGLQQLKEESYDGENNVTSTNP